MFHDISAADNTTHIYVGCNYNAVSGNCIDVLTWSTFIGSGDGVEFWCANIPISGWNVNFNPLMSLPLVEIGANVEQYQVEGFQSALGTTNAYRPVVAGTPTINTISTLGTVVNDTALGWYFNSSQRVKVNFSMTGAVSTSTDRFAAINNTSIGTNVAGGNDAENDGKRMWSFWTSSLANVNGSATFIMEPGNFLYIAKNGTTTMDTEDERGMITLTVEKDFSNTNMAHIIKPAVAIIQDEKPSNTASGSATSGSWLTRDLTVIKGESWFVTLDSSKFTLEPGTYEIFATAPFYMVEELQLRLYDVTNSVATDYGQIQYTRSANYDSVTTNLNAFKTITSSTEYRLEYRVASTSASNGLGAGANSWGGVMVYAQVQIRKLK